MDSLKFISLTYSNVKAEVATGCAKHANVKADVTARKAEVATGCAKHANVKADVTARKAEVATGCAKHANVKADVAARKAEAATGKADGNAMTGFLIQFTKYTVDISDNYQSLYVTSS
ncbi:hypothetical protein NIES4106_23220 [Fischerella sp. NIES-4106]|nr:hypothetical protein NIES4106_23220 [Fischerella sp. NIES-4106]